MLPLRYLLNISSEQRKQGFHSKAEPIVNSLSKQQINGPSEVILFLYIINSEHIGAHWGAGQSWGQRQYAQDQGDYMLQIEEMDEK